MLTEKVLETEKYFVYKCVPSQYFYIVGVTLLTGVKLAKLWTGHEIVARSCCDLGLQDIERDMIIMSAKKF